MNRWCISTAHGWDCCSTKKNGTNVSMLQAKMFDKLVNDDPRQTARQISCSMVDLGEQMFIRSILEKRSISR
jgi:hypothetical protein